MSKKHHKQKESKSPKELSKKIIKDNFLDIHWDRIIIPLLFVIPFIYFAQFLFSNTMIAGSDYLIGGYPYQKYQLEHKNEQESKIAFWYPHVVGGRPILGAPIVSEVTPFEQLIYIFPPQIVLALKFILVFFIAGLGMYFYLKEIGLSKYTAAIGAFAYQFIGNLATTPEAGQVGRAASVAIFPLMLFFIHRALKTRKIGWFILFAIASYFGFDEGHLQLSVFGQLVIIAYVIYYLLTHRKEQTGKDYFKIFGFGIVSLVMIFLLMAKAWLPVLAPILGAAPETGAARMLVRGYEYAASWAMPVVEIFDVFVPGFSGGQSNYWGPSSFKLHTEYFGIVAVIFALFTIVTMWKKRYVKFFLITAVIAALYCFGSATPVHRIFYNLPVFKQMRAPSLAFYLVSFSFITIAAIGFENIVINKELKKKSYLTIAGVILAGLIILLLIMVPAIGRGAAGDKVGQFEANQQSYMNGALLAIIFSAAAMLVGFLAATEKINRATAAVLVSLIVLLTQVPVMLKFLPKGPPPEQYYAADDIVRFLKKDTGVFRVFPLQTEPPLYPQYVYHGQDCYLLYHDIQSAGGYVANPIQRYQDYIGSGKSVMYYPPNLYLYPRLADLLNLKYIVSVNLPADLTKLDEGTRQFVLSLKNYLGRGKLVYQNNNFSVYESDSALPRAYIVPDYQVADDENGLGILKSMDFDPRKTVLLAEDPGVPHPEHPQEKLAMVVPVIAKYTANKIVIETDCQFDGFLVLCDNWHPDWQVKIDKRRANCLRANYTFRAVYVSAGKHTISFKYISTPAWIGIICWIVTICAILGFYIPLWLWKLAVKVRIRTAVPPAK